MKPFLLAVLLGVSISVLAQQTEEKAKVVFVREQVVFFKDLGEAPMKFIDAQVKGKRRLLLAFVDCTVKPGEKITIVKPYGAPQYFVDQRGEMWYNYMPKYLAK